MQQHKLNTPTWHRRRADKLSVVRLLNGLAV